MNYLEKIKDVKVGMDSNDVRVGMKVMPFKKTYSFYTRNFKDYIHNTANGDYLQKSGFLTVDEIRRDCIGYYYSLNGDFFTSDDFIPYTEIEGKQYLLFEGV